MHHFIFPFLAAFARYGGKIIKIRSFLRNLSAHYGGKYSKEVFFFLIILLVMAEMFSIFLLIPSARYGGIKVENCYSFTPFARYGG